MQSFIISTRQLATIIEKLFVRAGWCLGRLLCREVLTLRSVVMNDSEMLICPYKHFADMAQTLEIAAKIHQQLGASIWPRNYGQLRTTLIPIAY